MKEFRVMLNWHDAKAEPPEKSGEYLVIILGDAEFSTPYTMLLSFSKKYKKWNVYDNNKEEEIEMHEIKEVIAWTDEKPMTNEVTRWIKRGEK